ncbi:unnamed protein product [Amoebophrya sp. A25]|nr:unnamed protein product [Amoebophrya sp. A25]|eukprot:GSA25T00002419001.1
MTEAAREARVQRFLEREALAAQRAAEAAAKGGIVHPDALLYKTTLETTVSGKKKRKNKKKVSTLKKQIDAEKRETKEEARQRLRAACPIGREVGWLEVYLDHHRSAGPRARASIPEPDDAPCFSSEDQLVPIDAFLAATDTDTSRHRRTPVEDLELRFAENCAEWAASSRAETTRGTTTSTGQHEASSHEPDNHEPQMSRGTSSLHPNGLWTPQWLPGLLNHITIDQQQIYVNGTTRKYATNLEAQMRADLNTLPWDANLLVPNTVGPKAQGGEDTSGLQSGSADPGTEKVKGGSSKGLIATTTLDGAKGKSNGVSGGSTSATFSKGPRGKGGYYIDYINKGKSKGQVHRREMQVPHYVHALISEELDGLVRNILVALNMYQERVKDISWKFQKQKRLILGLKEIQRAIKRKEALLQAASASGGGGSTTTGGGTIPASTSTSRGAATRSGQHQVQDHDLLTKNEQADPEINAAANKALVGLIVAPDLEKHSRGLDDVVETLVEKCREANVPVVFAMSRKSLAYALKRLRQNMNGVSAVGLLSVEGQHAEWKKIVKHSEELRTKWILKQLEGE